MSYITGALLATKEVIKMEPKSKYLELRDREQTGVRLMIPCVLVSGLLADWFVYRLVVWLVGVFL